jgi:cell division septation protein DedD
MGIVESEVPVEDNTPQTPSEWFDSNVRATFHALIENVTLRSESEKVVLHALVDDLDKDPTEVIAKLEIAPINQGGGGYVDPVLAQVLADNSALRSDVRELLNAFTELRSQYSEEDTAAVAKVEADLAKPEPVAAPTPEPVAAPTPEPVAAPTPEPVAAPTPTPVPTPTIPPASN